jgi:hypothetical protein
MTDNKGKSKILGIMDERGWKTGKNAPLREKDNLGFISVVRKTPFIGLSRGFVV